MDADFYKANLQGAILKNTHLERANLAGANLTFADLSGANLEEAIMPDGNEFDPKNPLRGLLLS